MRCSAASRLTAALNGSYSFTPCAGSRENAAYQHTQGARAPLTGTTLPSGERASRVVALGVRYRAATVLGRALARHLASRVAAVIRDISRGLFRPFGRSAGQLQLK